MHTYTYLYVCTYMFMYTYTTGPTDVSINIETLVRAIVNTALVSTAKDLLVLENSGDHIYMHTHTHTRTHIWSTSVFLPLSRCALFLTLAFNLCSLCLFPFCRSLCLLPFCPLRPLCVYLSRLYIGCLSLARVV